MFVDFDRVFHPTEQQKQQEINFMNNIIKKSLETKGECCSNCKNLKGENCGHGWMGYKCDITNNWIEKDVRCDRYEFCGFVTGEIK